MSATARAVAADPSVERRIKEVFAHYDTDGSGRVDASELGHLLQVRLREAVCACPSNLLQDLAGDSRRISKNDVLFAMNEIENAAGGTIGAAEFRRWYLRKVIGHAVRMRVFGVLCLLRRWRARPGGVMAVVCFCVYMRACSRVCVCVWGCACVAVCRLSDGSFSRCLLRAASLN